MYSKLQLDRFTNSPDIVHASLLLLLLQTFGYSRNMHYRIQSSKNNILGGVPSAQHPRRRSTRPYAMGNPGADPIEVTLALPACTPPPQQDPILSFLLKSTCVSDAPPGSAAPPTGNPGSATG